MNAKARQLGLKRHARHRPARAEQDESTRPPATSRCSGVPSWPIRCCARPCCMKSVVLTRPHQKPKRIRRPTSMLGHLPRHRGRQDRLHRTRPATASWARPSAATSSSSASCSERRPTAGRFSQMRKLLDWGFAHYRMKRLVSTDATMGVVQVSDGDDDGRCHRARLGESPERVDQRATRWSAIVMLPSTRCRHRSSGRPARRRACVSGGKTLATRHAARRLGRSRPSRLVPTATPSRAHPRLRRRPGRQLPRSGSGSPARPRRVLVALASTL